MRTFGKIAVIEFKLALREIGTSFVAVLFPTVLLLALGAVPALRHHDAVFGGQRFIDVFCPSLVVITLSFLGLNTLPQRLGGYREKGVLRRLSTTPVHPAALLGAQLLINVVLASAAVVLLMVTGRIVFDVRLPDNLFAFGAAFLLGMAALFSLGLIGVAIAPTAKAATGILMPVFLLTMFFGGVYLPRYMLPNFLARIGDFMPPGVQALQDAWTGGSPQPLHLLVMAAIALVTGLGAAKLFRWE
ncbi:ABC transporter permease [Solihabitans fulvus]|uniref:ABC transporter permease n=1 Tax=Solihabitans fulvus TaxID=1892852 RepID=A0A5B2WS47_9PSEU|nr:ABC transporter permease [Solihabitans fulvus]KAA2254511.1 ABC transporter permease [Solihabitans fulvus]